MQSYDIAQFIDHTALTAEKTEQDILIFVTKRLNIISFLFVLIQVIFR